MYLYSSNWPQLERSFRALANMETTLSPYVALSAPCNWYSTIRNVSDRLTACFAFAAKSSWTCRMDCDKASSVHSCPLFCMLVVLPIVQHLIENDNCLHKTSCGCAITSSAHVIIYIRDADLSIKGDKMTFVGRGR